MSVPMIDLRTQFQQIKDEVMAEITEVFTTQYFILGPRVKKLEESMAELAGMPIGIGVSSGTDSLLLSVMALDIKPGDEVITTPYTFFATVSSIVRAGAKPVFADIDEDTFNLNVKLTEAAITSRTRALLPVHLFGQMIEPEAWKALSAKKNVVLIEDAAQAVGARRGKYVAGGVGDLAGFSFYPTKNLGGAGDGGMVLARDEKLAANVRMDRLHGGKDRYYHDRIGICGRLDELQAAVLLVKFKYLSSWNERRRKLASLYNDMLKGTPVKTPYAAPDAYHTYHQYVIRAPRRDELMAYLRGKGVSCDVYYPVPLHLQNCFSYLGYKQGQFPVSEQLSKDSLALPMSAELTEAGVNEVVASIKEFYGGAGA
jgi:dTDP-4-amino-4,6-dideoxygalactose transaminase